MKEKEKVIIEAAIKLFAQKGFTSTSIQEIANESGMSKGAFYLHFKSKDALMLAILNYYFDTLQQHVSEINDEDLDPKEKFRRQLTVLIETLVDNKEFLIMQSREQAVPLNEDVRRIIFKMHNETHHMYQSNLSNIYGEKVNPYLWDLSVLLEGIFQSYLKILFFNKEAFASDEVASFLLDRIDNIVQALVVGKEAPLLTEPKIQEMRRQFQHFFNHDGESVDTIIAAMKEDVAEMVDGKDLDVSLEVLSSEVSSEQPRTAVIQGMLSNFNGYPRFQPYIKQIKRILGMDR